jgi:hypothetical protein
MVVNQLLLPARQFSTHPKNIFSHLAVFVSSTTRGGCHYDGYSRVQPQRFHRFLYVHTNATWVRKDYVNFRDDVHKKN